MRIPYERAFLIFAFLLCAPALVLAKMPDKGITIAGELSEAVEMPTSANEVKTPINALPEHKLSGGVCGGYIPCSCGDTVIANALLSGDLLDCPGIGLYVNTSYVTINCNGHTISGSGEQGIRIEGASSTSIYGCAISHFTVGVETFDSNRITLQYNQFSHNNYGILIRGGEYHNIGNNEFTIMDGGMNIGMELYGPTHSNFHGNVLRNIPGWGIRAFDGSYNHFNNNIFVHVWNEAMDSECYSKEGDKYGEPNYWMGNTWSSYHYIEYDEDNHAYYSSNEGYPYYYSIPGEKGSKDYSPRQYAPSYTTYFSMNKAGPTTVCGNIRSYDNFFGRYVTQDNIDYGAYVIMNTGDQIPPQAQATYLSGGIWSYCIDFSSNYVPNGSYPIEVYINDAAPKVQYYSVTNTQVTLGGYVTTVDGNPIPGAQVFLFRKTNLNVPVASVTAFDGHFQFEEVIPGTYFLLAADGAFLNASKVSVQVTGLALEVAQNLTLIALTDTYRALSPMVRDLHINALNMDFDVTRIANSVTQQFKDDLDPDPAMTSAETLIDVFSPIVSVNTKWRNLGKLGKYFETGSIEVLGKAINKIANAWDFELMVLNGISSAEMVLLQNLMVQLQDDILNKNPTNFFFSPYYQQMLYRHDIVKTSFDAQLDNLIDPDFSREKAHDFVNQQKLSDKKIREFGMQGHYFVIPGGTVNRIRMGGIQQDYDYLSMKLQAYGVGDMTTSVGSLTANIGSVFLIRAKMFKAAKITEGVGFALDASDVIATFQTAKAGMEAMLYYSESVPRGWAKDLAAVNSQLNESVRFLTNEAKMPRYLHRDNIYVAEIEWIDKACDSQEEDICTYNVNSFGNSTEYAEISFNVENYVEDADITIVPTITITDNPDADTLFMLTPQRMVLAQGHGTTVDYDLPLSYLGAGKKQYLRLDIYYAGLYNDYIDMTFMVRDPMLEDRDFKAGRASSKGRHSLGFSLDEHMMNYTYIHNVTNGTASTVIRSYSGAFGISDLHIYDEVGNHVGYDYEAGGVVYGIPAKWSRSPISETIEIPETGGKGYTIMVELRDFVPGYGVKHTLEIEDLAGVEEASVLVMSGKISRFAAAGGEIELNAMAYEATGLRPAEGVSATISDLNDSEGNSLQRLSPDTHIFRLGAGEQYHYAFIYNINDSTELGTYIGTLNTTFGNSSSIQEVELHIAGIWDADLSMQTPNQTIGINETATLSILLANSGGQPVKGALLNAFTSDEGILNIEPGILKTDEYGRCEAQITGIAAGNAVINLMDLGNAHDELNITIIESYVCGDANDDEIVNILDILYLIDYKFRGGPAPIPVLSGDVNLDGLVNVLDIIYLIDFKFKNGPAPCSASSSGGEMQMSYEQVVEELNSAYKPPNR